MSYLYFLFLLTSLGCLLYADHTKKLAFFSEPRRSSLTVAASVLFFLMWDISGVALGIFATNPSYVSGIYLVTPNLPVEELLFLTLISYVTLLIWRWRAT